MKSLHVRRLALWPRFHTYVQEELEAIGPEVDAPPQMMVTGWGDKPYWISTVGVPIAYLVTQTVRPPLSWPVDTAIRSWNGPSR